MLKTSQVTMVTYTFCLPCTTICLQVSSEWDSLKILAVCFFIYNHHFLKYIYALKVYRNVWSFFGKRLHKIFVNSISTEKGYT